MQATYTSATGANPAPSTPGLADMIRVYETCLRVRAVSKQQLALSEDMALIAINAEIAAAKSTTNQEAFMILANETGKITQHMSDHVSTVLGHSEKLARQALLGVVNARRLAKIASGLAGIRRAEHARPVERLAKQLDAQLASLMQEIVGNQRDIETVRQALSKQNQRVARIITYFRIEASRDADHGSYFRNIAEDLNALITEAQTVSKELQDVLNGTGSAHRAAA
jgi:Mg2+ and Co2+ transporter CorA